MKARRQFLAGLPAVGAITLSARTSRAATSAPARGNSIKGAFKAKRIGLLTPFDANGNRNARRIFTALGFEVVSTFGFACANALRISHVPDEAKKPPSPAILPPREIGSMQSSNAART